LRVDARELLASPRVAPSILSADFARLGEQVETVMASGARVIHVDVMDGHFVPPITIGDLVARSIQEQVHEAGGIVDVHLMIERPERQIAAFADAGADIITIHQEATPHVHYALKAVREAGCLAGLAICPGTSAGVVHEVAHDLDVLLCMTVNPGWGGQEFIEHSIEKVERLKRLLPPEVPIEVDGGVDANTAPRCAAAGASMFVAGSAVFGAPDPGTAYEEIERSVNG
jgi:ribulose-phosphate 3-epimerase